MKKLNMMYNWIGPLGPISNTRIPSALDITRNMFPITVPVELGLKPVFYDIEQYEVANLVTPQWLDKNQNKPFVFELEMLHTREWDSNFKFARGILENTHVPNKVLYAVRQKIGYFLLTTPMESFLEDNMLKHIHNYFTLHNIPMSQIIYLTNSINCKQVYDNFCKRYNITDKINCEYIGTWVNLLVPDCANESLQKPYMAGIKDKTFLKFNRRYREQRFIFLLEIFKRGILDDFYISFTKEEPEMHMTFLDYATNLRNNINMNLTDDELSMLNDKLPLVLDTPDLSIFPVEKSLDDTKQFYDESLIHVIAETNFFSDIMHLTEKTLKPIMYKQPFIVAGPRFSLEYMRKLGFKTFNDIWDESYDTIEDNMERMYRVIDLVENISKKTQQEKIDISNRVKEIVEYNFNEMKYRKPKEVFEFVERYGE